MQDLLLAVSLAMAFLLAGQALDFVSVKVGKARIDIDRRVQPRSSETSARVVEDWLCAQRIRQSCMGL